MTDLVTQPDRRPTRKVTLSGVGAAVGSIAGTLAHNVADLSAWLSWLSNPEVQLIAVMGGAAVGSWAAGWFAKERAS